MYVTHYWRLAAPYHIHKRCTVAVYRTHCFPCEGPRGQKRHLCATMSLLTVFFLSNVNLAPALAERSSEKESMTVTSSHIRHLPSLHEMSVGPFFPSDLTCPGGSFTEGTFAHLINSNIIIIYLFNIKCAMKLMMGRKLLTKIIQNKGYRVIKIDKYLYMSLLSLKLLRT